MNLRKSVRENQRLVTRIYGSRISPKDKSRKVLQLTHMDFLAHKRT